MKKLYVMLAAALLLALLSGCAFTDKLSQLDLPELPGERDRCAHTGPGGGGSRAGETGGAERPAGRGHRPGGRAAAAVFL